MASVLTEKPRSRKQKTDTISVKAFPEVSQEWRALLSLIPKYDCFRNAERFYFDERVANKVCQFFETRLHYMEGEVAGQLVKLEPWQKAFLGCLFGWKRKADGLRRYRKVILLIPRKNTKTTMAAGIGIMMMELENEVGQQIVSAAADFEQAALTVKIAKGMIQQDEGLDNDLRVMAKHIEHTDPMLGHTWKVLSKAPLGKHGLNVNCALIDELHAHHSGELCDVITSSMGSRRQPLTIYTTTSDFDQPSKCNEVVDYGIAVANGDFDDPEFFPCMYYAEPDEDWTSEELWARVNPNLGKSVKIDFLRSECQEAQRVISKQNTFKRLYLNIRTGQKDAWIAIEDWDRGAGLLPDERPEHWRDRMVGAFAKKPCWGGLDLGATSDLTAFSLVFDGGPMKRPDAVYSLHWFWTPEDNIKSKDEVNQKLYWEWKERGFLWTTPGSVTDYNRVRTDIIQRILPRFWFQSAGVDTKFQGMQLCVQLREVDGKDFLDGPQTFAGMSAASLEFQNRVQAGTFIHGANPILRWMASNVQVKQSDDGGIRPVKPDKSSPLKIDGIVTSIMALDCYNKRDERTNTSGYGQGKELFVLGRG